jgi:type I restriction enzyme S subunit
MSDLRPGWDIASVGEVTSEVRSGFASGKHNATGAGIPHLRPMNVSRLGEIDMVDVKYVDPSVDDRRLEPGDILFNNTNSPVLVGKTALVRQIRGEAAFSNHMTRLRAIPGLDPAFLAFQLHFLWMTGRLSHLITNHVNQASISAKVLAERVQVAVPPAAEQERIVTAIEEQLSRLGAAESATASARRRLAGFYDSVLQATFDPAWPRELLDSLNELERPICYGILKPKTPEPGTVPYVEVRSIAKGQIKVGELHRTTAALHQEFRRSELRPGDVTLAIRGSFDRAAVVPDDLVGANVSRDVARIAPTPHLLPEFLAAFLVSPEARRFFRAHARGVAVQGVNIGDLRRLPVPNPTVEIQRAATRRIEAARSAIDHIEDEIRVGDVRSHQLRRSILTAAFAGQLVPQDPDDEPASLLLERIEAGRPAATPTRRTQKAEAS